MGTEKLAAAMESWSAMIFSTGLILEALTTKNFLSLMPPWSLTEPGLQTNTNELSFAAISIFNTGVAPIHRCVMANAKRFGYA
jgi:hypothetical protein